MLTEQLSRLRCARAVTWLILFLICFFQGVWGQHHESLHNFFVWTRWCAADSWLGQLVCACPEVTCACYVSKALEARKSFCVIIGTRSLTPRRRNSEARPSSHVPHVLCLIDAFKALVHLEFRSLNERYFAAVPRETSKNSLQTRLLGELRGLLIS